MNRAGWDSFLSFLTYMVGDGSCIKFWHDSWCGDQQLRERFPELFRLAWAPEAVVVDQLRLHGSNRHWDVEFTRTGMWLISLHAGRVCWVILRLERFGKWSLTASCGAFGGKEMIELLMEWKNPSRLSYSIFCTLSYTGQRLLT